MFNLSEILTFYLYLGILWRVQDFLLILGTEYNWWLQIFLLLHISLDSWRWVWIICYSSSKFSKQISLQLKHLVLTYGIITISYKQNKYSEFSQVYHEELYWIPIWNKWPVRGHMCRLGAHVVCVKTPLGNLINPSVTSKRFLQTQQ